MGCICVVSVDTSPRHTFLFTLGCANINIDFLKAHRAEVSEMLETEYNQEEVLKLLLKMRGDAKLTS